MIPAAAQTLARILADGTSLSSTEQIDFNPPSPTLVGQSVLTVYCYNIQECESVRVERQEHKDTARLPVQLEQFFGRWFELSFLVSAWDGTVLGELQLLSEALLSLLRYQSQYQERILAPNVLGRDELAVDLSSKSAIDPVVLWRSLGLPMRPALYISVRIPIVVEINRVVEMHQPVCAKTPPCQ